MQGSDGTASEEGAVSSRLPTEGGQFNQLAKGQFPVPNFPRGQFAVPTTVSYPQLRLSSVNKVYCVELSLGGAGTKGSGVSGEW